ncbi:hypothetical protein ABBQ38_002321 [Trebouxia sp. C0009 RCD-2024]
MTTQTERRANNKQGTFISVKTGFKSIFTDPRLANVTLRAVNLTTPILIHRDLLANLHAVRLCEEGVADADMPLFNQTFFNQCSYAVTRATGSGCAQFKASTNPSLATTLQLYEQHRPVTINKPERPTFMKDILNEAAQLAQTNFKNHISANFEGRTKLWLKRRLRNIPYVSQLPTARFGSWVRLLYWAGTTPATRAADLLPKYTSLAAPPTAAMSDLENLVNIMHAHIYELPVTDDSLANQSSKYLKWMYFILCEFQAVVDAAPAGQRLPKLFTLLPQKSNQTAFITISTTSLHKLLKEEGFQRVGSLSTKSCSEFTANADHWWGIFTSSFQFCQRINRQFKHRLSTDGVSVGVTTFNSKQTQPPPPAKSAKRKRNASRPSTWVQGLPANTPLTATRILGLDPGRNSLFTAVIHEGQATDSLQAPIPIKHQVLSWSRSRWQEASGIKHAKLMRELWLHDDPILQEDLLTTPTPKVSSTAAFGRHIHHRLTHLPAAVSHFGARKYRQLRWSRYMQKQRAMASMCNSITSGKSDTIVAYGDAKFACCGKGNEATPTTSLRKKLGKACKVYDVDEFRTSKLCCACHHAMAGMPLPSIERCRNDGDYSYSVRLCSNRGCERMMWNRDVNAAINMLKLFLAWTSGADKPSAFARTVH